ncbi:MAG: peptidyl-prolyl cis-trans isomerase [Verrucomicrobiota bacterium]|nr:peptidyl-prolyl cis-trans isomerase [Verrucomicrobiota bacterium]
MIGTIRKHSKWLWAIVIVATVISFLYWGSSTSRNGGGEASGDLGSVYGQKITPDEWRNSRAEVELDYFFKTGEWPEKNPKVTQKQLRQDIYFRLLLNHKADDLDIEVDPKTAGEAGRTFLRLPWLARVLGVGGPMVPFDVFVQRVLAPQNLTAGDFMDFVQHELTLEQLVQTFGLPGALTTPQEAAAAYKRDHQEWSAEIVLFSASNYLSRVTVTPPEVREFYTNYLAEYRLPDRVQVSYVAFETTNYWNEAEKKLTNLDETVEAIYDQNGPQAFPDAKTPAEARSEIRQAVIRRQALNDAHQDANDFANALFSMTPPRPENLAVAAKQKGLAVQTTEPFARDLGPEKIGPAEAFTTAAFGLTSDVPFAGPVEGPDGYYVMALVKNWPSEIPSFEQLRNRIEADCKYHEALLMAQRAGTNFDAGLTGQMASGRAFGPLCQEAGLHPELLPPFSLSTQDLPALKDRVELPQLKQAAFTTPPGQASGFIPTDNGGFILYVQSRLPLDQTQMAADLPQFTAALRRQRESEAFNRWLLREANRELATSPAMMGTE